MINYETALKKLEAIGQTQLLSFYNDLNEDEQKKLLAQIEAIDFSVIDSKVFDGVKETISPIKTLTLDEIELEKEEDRKLGLEALKNGKVGCVLLAGGMGTRLGSPDPKGMYNVGVNKDLYIFECQIKTLLKVVEECGSWVHLFVMTSPLNNDKTVKFYEEHNYFGYNKEYVKFFIQDEAPIIDADKKVLLADKSTVATSPNGNGGWYSSMANAGLIDYAKHEGIEYLNIYSVDNVLQYMADPLFVGATIKRGCDVGSKVVRKVNPDEKVGVICLADGHPSITEYIDLTDELRNSKDENGEYLYNFGVILNYLFKIESLDKTLGQEFNVHKVYKKVNYMDLEGNFIEAKEPNAYKFETLVLDMIKMMDKCLSFEVCREKEFAPIKNLTGVDSVDTARELLKKNGIQI